MSSEEVVSFDAPGRSEGGVCSGGIVTSRSPKRPTSVRPGTEGPSLKPTCGAPAVTVNAGMRAAVRCGQHWLRALH